VNGVLAQRLLRTLCNHCKSPVELSDTAIAQYGLKRFLPAGERKVYEPVGCDHCIGSGYAGRTAIHELFYLDEGIRRTIQSGADASELHAAARRQGMITLYEDGLRKVVAGQSSLEEVLRVTQDQSGEDDQAPLDAATVTRLQPA
jgi:general secretion pathway protein E